MTVDRYVEPESANYFYSVVLDHFLGMGWFRMKNKMFTTDLIITEEEGFLDVYWMRIDLKKFKLSKSQEKILRSTNQFSTEANKQLSVSAEMERLFQKYKRSIDFNIANTVIDSLYDDSPFNDSFDSGMITIKDRNKLIAFGVFDAGMQSMAGIMNIYDPAYSSHSLGKALILKKIQYALDNGKEYFYPGYTTRVVSKFSYKKTFCPDAIEIFDQNVWIPFEEWDDKKDK